MTARDLITKVLRSYLPVGVVAAAFLLMAAAVEPLPRDEIRSSGPLEVPLGGPATGPASGIGSTDDDAGEAGTDPAGDQGSPGDATGSDEAAGPGGPGGPGTTSAGGVQPCADRAEQVPGDPYSPPCLTFSGDNGGTTHQGVTAEEIVVAVRQLEGPSAAEIFSDLSGQNISDSPEAYRDTVLALAEYFSERFELYGRRLRIEFFDGRGVGAAELLGGGIEAAQADAVRAGSPQEIGAFADISALTLPYADALTRQGVVNLGAPYPSRAWFEERAPYAWSLFPDGTVVVEAAVSAIVSRLLDQPDAEYAGPSMAGRPRVYAVVAPENVEYQESVTRYIQLVEEAGFSIRLNIRYKLDINSMPNQASNIIAQLKDAGVTTVICACDPVMLALGMAPKANEQSYEPEWLTGGLAFVEQDIVSQLIDPRQWQRAFGIAFNAESEPIGGSFPYAAYKQMRPNDEPAFGVEEIYYQMYILALGLQLAGPNLTPESFMAGLYSYPGGAGPRGYWDFGPGNHTPTADFRELWWDTERISPQNNRPGAWVALDGGRRYFPGEVPREPGAFFQ